MLTIRLSRIGKKKKPTYRLIISEKTKDPYGRALEILGAYNPFTKELTAKKDRIEYWLKNGAGMSPTVNNLLLQKEIIKGDKVTASKTGKNTKEEVIKRLKEENEKRLADIKAKTETEDKKENTEETAEKAK
ncbi:MAG: 30S ribosomal protein S16 [Candidatus Falkowbacteria bacterium GW2011_GWC2_38_22]|uniref:Small ribosomal subunit protein bS16 n=1 Tax=Candidatus Falkowbacteria bacterium GW2011_GWE1_38_31 TaxID=1618638 RepID=A0A0G0K6X5_9BACT|nr:MAG: 30S ribosomal protein S16 [Candidatus Falkowbacteria bacterium GW2011_GWF2_38_1205]KKQ61781.1 MAG: 30S ribosomal protein S16 [Candidatus Falkowbacteria bacterium GW2011_GWC2_38_22]KKQ64089.1 MAG: 30S ribosomal protein S16 [Candidatus Falkowbacteria bacterium GW2011_GWF1_38_22]KKQ66562.1 MAG: 30S ribosomal protein S16 [Candidatus Falkowbacteria bacterium GW2011_GWE2_38_254]KKQ71195.1 MAG: 30S ribosomal protein S16 [Candidatus Falkowbacteria bacterium GW2011_GWE1_38_31]KKQ73323.1 MAG: 30